MAIETLDDIIEELADNLGIYGAHGEESPDCECRCCFSMQLGERIRAALEAEEKLNPPDIEQRIARLERRVLPMGTANPILRGLDDERRAEIAREGEKE